MQMSTHMYSHYTHMYIYLHIHRYTNIYISIYIYMHIPAITLPGVLPTDLLPGLYSLTKGVTSDW